VGVEDVEQDGALVDVLNVLNLLSNVLRSRADTANGQEDVILEEILSEHLNIAGEGGREHESLAALNTGHILTLNDAANLGLETHVKHAIGLIENKVLDVAERDAATLNQIHESAGGSDKKIATAFNLAELGSYLSTAIDDAGTNPRTVGKLPRLVVNLRDKLASGGEYQGGGVRLALATKVAALTGRNGRGAVGKSLRQDGEQETTCLAGTCLGACHEVATADDNGDGVLLNRRGDLVPRKLDVGEQMGVQRGGGERQNRLRRVATGGRDGNVIVLLEVDASVLLRRVVGSTEQLALHARVGRANDVLSVAPLTIARATSSVTGATAGTSSAGSADVEVATVGVRVETTTTTLMRATAGIPTRLLCGSGAIETRATGTTGAASPVTPAAASIEVVVAEMK
jgi:hypothetical protein